MIFMVLKTEPYIIFHDKNDVYTSDLYGDYTAYPLVTKFGDLRNAVSVLGASETSNMTVTLDNSKKNEDGNLILSELFGNDPPLRVDVDIFDSDISIIYSEFSGKVSQVTLLDTSTLTIES